MSQKVQVILTDDVDGGPADETLEFAVDGVTYEIDLSEANAQSLRDGLGPYIIAGRRTGGRVKQGRTVARPTTAPRRDLTAMRKWAQEQGYTVSDRGRISGEVQAAYEAAHA